MFVLLYLAALALFGASFALPHTSTVSFNDYFVHPNERNSGPFHGRIIGGQEAQPHAFPYQIGLYANNLISTAFCGGSLVSKNYVLTAAHCVENALSADLILGAHNIDDPSESSQIRVHSDNFIIHAEWDRNQLINDIALIRLDEPIEETDDIKIIKVANTLSTYAGENGIIAGWGKTTNAQVGVTPVLRYAISNILTNQECRNVDSSYAGVITPTHLCLSGINTNGVVGTCSGDSGGPLVVNGVQVGVISFGYNDCLAGKPSVFTRLTNYNNWLRDHSDIDI